MATKYIGRLVDVGIGKESSRGAGAVATQWLPKNNITVEDKVTKARSTASYGNINMEGNSALVAQRWAEGDIEMDLHDKSFGLLLLSLLGTVNTTGPSDSAYTHTFSLQNDNQHDSLAISVHEAGVGDLMFKLAMIESMELTIVPEDVVKLKIGFMGKKAVDSSHTVTYNAQNKFLGRHLSFKIASLTSGLTGASKININKLVLKFQKRLRASSVLGTVEPIDFLNQAFSIEGDVEMDVTDRTYHDLMTNGTYNAVRIDLTNSQALIGATSVPQFRLDLSRCDFEAWESQRPNDEITTQKFTFKALYDITNGNIINDCFLINGQSSY